MPALRRFVFLRLATALVAAISLTAGCAADTGEPEAAPRATPDPTVVATPDPTVVATPDPTVVATPDPTVVATPDPEPQEGDKEGAWEYLEFENSAGSGRGYGVAYEDGSIDSAALFIRCTSWSGVDLFFATSELLHGGDNEAQVQYRVSGGQSVTQTWWSDEEFDSAVWPNTDSQEAQFLAELERPEAHTLYVTFTSVYDSSSMAAEFDIRGALKVLANVREWCS